MDFLARTRLRKSEIQNLIKTGCFDGFNMNQPELLSVLDGEYGRARGPENDLFTYVRGFQSALHPGLGDYSLTRKCLNELELLGFMLSGNILDILDLHPASRESVPCARLGRHAGRRVKVFGWPITARAHHIPGRGDMRFITVEDKSGCADIVLWPEAYERYREAARRPGPYEIWGTVRADWGTHSLFARAMRNVAWSPAQVDFELAQKRLLKSYRGPYLYRDTAAELAA
jgi:DNA polymerase III alpha subunit